VACNVWQAFGAGTGACGILIAAAAAARGMTVDALLTDRNPAALELAASSAALVVGRCRYQRLKLKCEEPLSNVAFDFNLRRHIVVAQSTEAAPACIRTARYAFGQETSLVLDVFYNTWCRAGADTRSQ
jgi:hypothetical protein